MMWGVKRTARLALDNRDLLLSALRAVAPAGGLVLELGSGTGEHALALARALPHLLVQPSDPEPVARASIAAWREEAGLPNLLAPLDLDLLAPAWRRITADLLLCVNVLHVAPATAGEALLDGAAALPPGTRLLLYGPFIDGPPPARVIRFDAELRAWDAALGIRPLAPLLDAAARRGLALESRRAGREPGDQLLVFRRAAPE
jgi:SAM-dependent methyltransferase